MRLVTVLFVLSALGACASGAGGDPAGEAGGAGGSDSVGGSGGGSVGGGAGGSGGVGGSGGGPTGKAAACADEFGSALTNSFGRIDGTVVAVVGPADTACALPNDDHLVLQVAMQGEVYRMVVNVLSTSQEPRVFLAEREGPLPGAPFSEGWHPEERLDYVTTLGAHARDFAPHGMDELVALVSAPIEPGATVSVYATSSGGSRASSAHLVHRNQPGKDGAIVLGPDGPSPRWLLFRFAEQMF